MSYEELSLKGFIHEMKEVSSGPHARKFCFVLGAGASLTSGIKSGQELVKIWDAELQLRNEKSHNKWKEDLNITEENKFSFYSKPPCPALAPLRMKQGQSNRCDLFCQKDDL